MEFEELVGAIGGRVTQGGAGVDGVTVTTGNRSVLTGSDGSYRIADLDPGTYVVRPSRAGYQFAPVERTVPVDGEEGGVDFTATPLGPVALAGLSVDPVSVKGGTGATGTVHLSGPASPGGLSIKLASNDARAASVPRRVTAAAGATSATFAVTTSRVRRDTRVKLTAKLGSLKATTKLQVGR